MDDLTKIVLTASFTILGSIFVFVAGQLIIKFVIEPVHDLKKLIGEIRFSLVFYAQAISTPVGNTSNEDEAQNALRKLSCDLRTKIEVIPFYKFWSRFSRGFLPVEQSAFEASKCLMGLSNSVHQSDRSDKNVARISKIEKLLNYKSVEKME